MLYVVEFFHSVSGENSRVEWLELRVHWPFIWGEMVGVQGSSGRRCWLNSIERVGVPEVGFVVDRTPNGGAVMKKNCRSSSETRGPSHD